MIKRILLIEDHDDFRDTVRDFLKTQDPELEIFEADCGESGIVQALKEKPDIVLMDIRLPNANGIETAGDIKKHLPECKIIVLTMFATESFRKIFHTSDIMAYLGKGELYEKLMPLVHQIFKAKHLAKAKERKDL